MTTHQHNKHNKTNVMVLAVLIILLGIMHAENVSGYTYFTAHSNSASGVDRSVIDGVGAPYGTEIPKGHCSHCHEPTSAVPLPSDSCGMLYYLFMDNCGANKNELCYACHETFDFGYGLGYGRHGIYQGRATYTDSVHNTSEFVQWPIPATPGAPPYDDPGNCRNCHNPHGYADGAGFRPLMLFIRDSVTGDDPAYEMGCEACHDADGPAIKDIKSELNKSYGHPAHDYKNRHTIDESESWEIALYGDNRHAECVDCHNPHTIGGIDPNTPKLHPMGTAPPRDENGNSIYDPNFGSDVLQGVWGVDRASWPDGEWVVLEPPAYPMYAEKEYQICAKCHQDIVNEMRPSRKAMHPVITTMNNKDYGNKGLDATQMNDPWRVNVGNTTMYCGDCHGPYASGNVQGPHGSSKNKMLLGYRGDWRKDVDGEWLRLPYFGFCQRCHTGSNNIHTHEAHRRPGYPGAECCTCHKLNVHGSGKVRFSRAVLNWPTDTYHYQSCDPHCEWPCD